MSERCVHVESARALVMLASLCKWNINATQQSKLPEAQLLLGKDDHMWVSEDQQMIFGSYVTSY